jgi:dihydrofolate synthase/folylpolyglutamate synthase
VVTVARSPRALDLEDLEAAAIDVFGEDRVQAAPTLVGALDLAFAAAESESATGGTGVIVTGSVVTVGEARALLHRDTTGEADDELAD